MADNKNQHFVPRCHLRPFTKDAAGEAINLFNLTRAKAVPDASARSQCSSDYFYGRDKRLEDAIQMVERGYAEVVRNLLTAPGPLLPGHRIVLKRFAYLQHIRTEAASRAMAERTFAMIDSPGVEIERPSLKEATKQAVLAAMLHYASSMKLIDDLKICLVKNETAVPFVTSDNPAVLANRWHQADRRTRGRSFGLGRAGIVLILPLSPKLLCLLYDGDVYSVPNSAGWLIARKQADVRHLNEHQILNCAANLYFQDWSFRDSLAADVREIAPLRPQTHMEVVTAVLGETTAWGSRFDVVPKESLRQGQDSMIHIATNHPRPSGWPRFLSFRSGGQVFGNDTFAGFTRRWCLEQGFVRGEGYYRQRP